MTQQTETVADIFSELAIESMGNIPRALQIVVKPRIAEATQKMIGNPEGTRDMLLAYLPRLCRAAEITPDDLRVLLDAEAAVAASPTLD